MERNSLTFCTSSRKGRLGGAAYSPVSVGSSDLGVAKEEADESAPYSSCSSTPVQGGATVGCAEGGTVVV